MLNYRLISLLALTTLSAVQTQSCRPINPNAKLKDAQSDPCDLQKMGEASSKASAESFQCAFSSLKMAGALATPSIAKTIYEITVGTKEIYDAVMSSGELIGDLVSYVKTGGVEREESENGVAYDEVKDLQRIINVKLMTYKTTLPGPARTAMYKCLAGQYSVLKDILAVFDLATKLKDAEGIDLDTIKTMAVTPLTFTTTLLDMMSANTNCVMWLEGKRSIAMHKMLKGIKKIQEPVQLVLTIGNCGVAIGKGGYLLAQNSMCLAEDLGNYYESRKNLEKQRDNFAKDDNLPKDDLGSGINVCMRKYGIWLQNQSFYSYVYRSSVCGDYCGNADTRHSYFKTKTNDIFQNDTDRAWCPKYGLSSGAEAVRSCVVMCCDQENGCVTDAMNRAGYN